MQTWLADSQSLVAAGGFLAAVVAAFVAGYVVGRAGRPREAPRRPARPAPRLPDEAEPLPEMGGDEARLMDLSGIRDAEPEPPPPMDPGPPPRRR